MSSTDGRDPADPIERTMALADREWRAMEIIGADREPFRRPWGSPR